MVIYKFLLTTLLALFALSSCASIVTTPIKAAGAAAGATIGVGKALLPGGD